MNEHFVYKQSCPFSFFQPEDWNHWAHLVTALRQLENAESAEFGDPERIIDHLFHIGSRQFEWQQGFLNYSEIFRGIYIYGQGKCAEHFNEKFGISIDSLFSYGFALLSQFLTSPYCRFDIDLSQIGLKRNQCQIASEILSADLEKITSLCRLEREMEAEIAFKPSVLRLYPCVRAGHRSRILFCPLPELIIKRISTGIFYDIIDGGQSIREDYGRRFESYVKLLVDTYQPQINSQCERLYKNETGRIPNPRFVSVSRRWPI